VVRPLRVRPWPARRQVRPARQPPTSSV
jgi:hypothetical protein